jgi:phosphatidate cytidylyltransferase
MKNFLTRALTATVFAALMLGGILWSPFSFYLLFLLISSGALWEFCRLARSINSGYQGITAFSRILVVLAGIGIVTCYAGTHFNWRGIPLDVLGRWLFFPAIIIFLVTELALDNPGKITRITLSFFGLVYISMSAGLMVDLRLERSFHGFALVPLVIILLIWTNDTMAYIVGSLMGRTPFFPTVSPKKTWEGTVGGALLTLLAATLFGWLGKYDTVADWFVLGAMVGIFGTLGDLFESKLKRIAGKKDSGHIMPGHGGFLDRFDSLLFVIPFAWLFAYYFM